MSNKTFLKIIQFNLSLDTLIKCFRLLIIFYFIIYFYEKNKVSRIMIPIFLQKGWIFFYFFPWNSIRGNEKQCLSLMMPKIYFVYIKKKKLNKYLLCLYTWYLQNFSIFLSYTYTCFFPFKFLYFYRFNVSFQFKAYVLNTNSFPCKD